MHAYPAQHQTHATLQHACAHSVRGNMACCTSCGMHLATSTSSCKQPQSQISCCGHHPLQPAHVLDRWRQPAACKQMQVQAQHQQHPMQMLLLRHWHTFASV